MNKQISNSNIKKRLYVFDFDETLVFDKATIYVTEPTGKRKSFTSYQFHNYEMKPGEEVDVSDFSKLNSPTPNYKILSILEKHLDEAAILSARSTNLPIIEYMNSIGLEVPEIAVVGERYPTTNTSQKNAQRKREWIQKQIEMKNFDYVEFWDDSPLNIKEVEKLKAVYPNKIIITHHVVA